MEEADLAIVDQLLGTTRSVRRKLDFERPVPRDVIEECIDLALQAPTGAGGEAWRFVVITNPETGISGKTQQRRLSAIRTFYNYLVRERRVKHNPALSRVRCGKIR